MMKSQKKSILVVGGDGAIGSHLVASFESDGWDVFSTTRRVGHLTQKNLFYDLSRLPGRTKIPPSYSLDFAVVCAGITSVDQCEKNPSATRIINVDNTLELIKMLRERGIFVAFLSSDLVFDGLMPTPSTQDPVCPTTEYGRQKVEVEQSLLRSSSDAVVIRLSKVIKPDMPLFDEWVRRLRRGQSIQPYVNKMMSPISLNFCTEAITRIISARVQGITHVSASKDISYADAAMFISKKLKFDQHLVHPTLAISDKFIDRRYATLDSSDLKLIGLFAPEPMHALDQLRLKT